MDRDIVLMHPVARLDIAARKTDDLPEFADRLPVPDRLNGDLVAARNGCRDRDAAVDHLASRQAFDGDNDIIGVMETKRARRGHAITPPEWL